MNDKTIKVLEFDKIREKLASFAASELGKKLARELLPKFNYDEVRALLKETSDAVDVIIKRNNIPLAGIHDIKASLRHAEIGAILNASELIRISDTLYAARNLKKYINDGPQNQYNVVHSMIESLEINKKVEDKIKNAILSQDEISDNASPALGSIRRKIRELQSSIKDKLNDIIKSSRNQKFMQESIVTMRGDRYVIPVKQEYKSEIPGLIHDSSSSGATIFIEPMAVVEANNQIKQQMIKEQLEIDKILSDLTTDVVSILDSLKSNIEILANLDFIFAKARFSLSFNCVCPHLKKEKNIMLKKARHPLLDKDKAVPIDFWLGEEFNTLVITGPNTGGKTVALKTVGLLSIMAQSGLHIPANDGTTVCIFDKIFVDIGDEQSIEQSLSTFSSHMKNIIKIINEADTNTLVLLDELGAGTDPSEGAALAISILDTFQKHGVMSVITTHYNDIKVYAETTQGFKNACFEFDIQTLKPTYRLLIGVPGKSNALLISQRLGLSNEIIARAKEFLSSEEIKFEDVLLSIEKNLTDAKAEKMQAESLKLEVMRLKEMLEKQKNETEAQKERIIREAKEEARNILSEAKEEALQAIRRIKEIEKEQESADRNKEMEALKMSLGSKIKSIEGTLFKPVISAKTEGKPPETLKIGDGVLVVGINQHGTVISLPDKNKEVVVQVGAMKMNVPVKGTRLIKNKNKEESFATFKVETKAKNISPQIDLRGQRLDEALDVVDKYIDDASISGLKKVTIIHGKGTGILRSGIHQYLKTNSNVKTYRLGRFGEGEMGVTVVELK